MNVDIDAAHGRLEAIFERPESAAASPSGSAALAFAAIVCHPHPQHGGTMRNNVVYRVASALREAGVATLRFNFRGVGRSTGIWSGGAGEVADAVAALDHLGAECAGASLIAAGFSFGAHVALRVGAGDARVAALLGAGLATTMDDFAFLAACTKPKAIVQAENDQYGPATAVAKIVNGWPDPTHFVAVPGATHLFPGKLDDLERAAGSAVRVLLADLAGR